MLGYIIGGILIEINQQSNWNVAYIRREYIYSIVYGALFYTALVTLVRRRNLLFLFSRKFSFFLSSRFLN